MEPGDPSAGAGPVTDVSAAPAVPANANDAEPRAATITTTRTARWITGTG